MKCLSILEEMLSVDWLSLPPFEFNEIIVESWLKSVAKNEGFELGEVALVFCTDEELLEMNRKHLDHDFYTDIITFDYSEDNSVAGDLFVSVDRVRENASDLLQDFNRELHRVVVHGVLHLCGYGDKSDEEEAVMREKEDFYLNKLKGFT
ncbi:MAG: rRNA maturation RNase YbeY [Crocinitomicaceae bacterium]